MNTSKTLIAAMAAATIVGTVGFVSAQTTTDSSAPTAQGTGQMTNQNGTTSQTQQPSSTQAPVDMSAPAYVAPATDTTAPSAGNSGVMSSEPAPKADRN